MRTRKHFVAGFLAAYMAGAALIPAFAQGTTDGAQLEETLPDVTDPDTGQVFPLTPDQKRILKGLVVKCEEDLIAQGKPEDVAAESCAHTVDEYIRALKKAPPAGGGQEKRVSGKPSLLPLG